MQFPQIKLDTFYLVGAILFFIIGIGNLISLFLTWNLINIGAKISGSAGLIFNGLLFTLFFGLFLSLSKPDLEVTEEIEKIMKEIKEK